MCCSDVGIVRRFKKLKWWMLAGCEAVIILLREYGCPGYKIDLLAEAGITLPVQIPPRFVVV